MKKIYLLFYTTLIANLAFFIYFLCKHFSKLNYFIKSCNYYWLLVILAIVLFHYILNALVFKFFVYLYTKQYYFHQGLIVFLISSFYAKVLPGVQGDKVAQTYVLKNQGIKLETAASLSIMNFILNKLVMFAIAILSLFRFKVFKIFDRISFFVIVFGFAINVLVILFILFMNYFNFVVSMVAFILTKIHLFKSFETAKIQIKILVENFKIEINRLFSNFKTFFLLFNVIFLDFFIYNLIPFFIALAFGNNYINSNFIFLDAFFILNFHGIATKLLPFPGISEFLFFSLFSKFYVNDAITGVSHFLWHILTFYFDLIIGGLTNLFYRKIQPKDTKPIEIDKKTFVSIQIETFSERKKSFLQTTNNLEKKLTKVLLEKKDSKIKKYNNLDLEEENITSEAFLEEKNKKKKKKKWHKLDL